MPSHIDPNAGAPLPKDQDHEHHLKCISCLVQCHECSTKSGVSSEFLSNRMVKANIPVAQKRPSYRHTAKPPWVDFEKQRELVPRINPEITENAADGSIGLVEKLTTCRITFMDREPERSDSGKAITIHQCEVHLVIVTWDES